MDPFPSTLEQAQADYLAGKRDAARGALEALIKPDRAAHALLAMCRVRQVLDHPAPESPLDQSALLPSLEEPFTQPRLEAERLFALGSLAWLAGEPERAEGHFLQAYRQVGACDAAADPSETAYWLARVQLLLRRPQALAEFEKVMRSLKGSPRLTCCYVDLLWRAGQAERAEQVWKTLRANPRIKAVEEAFLLEARALMRRGELSQAERVLTEAEPRGAILRVEKALLLTWVLAERGQLDAAAYCLHQAEAGIYPAAALRTWRSLFDRRRAGAADPPELPACPAGLATFLRGQQARQAGHIDEATRAFREALAFPRLQPFARYGLACLGQDDFANLLASQPGLFLAVRCRAWLLAERFRLRQATPGEALNSLDQAVHLGYQNDAVEHYRLLALALTGSPDALGLKDLAAAGPDLPSVQRANRLRAAIEIAARRLPPVETADLLFDWSNAELLRQDPPLREVAGLQILRSLLLTTPPASQDPGGKARAEALLARAQALLGDHPKVAFVQDWLNPTQVHRRPLPADAEPVIRLWRKTCELQVGGVKDWETWRNEVMALRSFIRLRAPAHLLLVQEAGLRADPVALAGLLQDLDPWRLLPGEPPEFVLRVVVHVSDANPEHHVLNQAINRWLRLWDTASLNPPSRHLAIRAGLVTPDPALDPPPPETPPVPWFLYQASQTLGRDSPAEALAWVRRALGHDPELKEAGANAEVVRKALPELEKAARAQALAEAARFTPAQPPLAAGLLADAADLLDGDPQGQAVMEFALHCDPAAARDALIELTGRDDLPPRLSHHLALLCHRAALAGEEREQGEAAHRGWRPAWLCWLRVLASRSRPGAEIERDGRAMGPEERLLLARLLDVHLRYVSDYLSRDAIADARRHWGYVEQLIPLAREHTPALAGDVAESVARFREDLATHYLTSTREVMRNGAVVEGWRADYASGLGHLRRLLSLDRDNLRLLTAVIDICGDWFLDCYNNEEPGQLMEQVERFTPFALKLARLVEERPGELAARAALAEFYKFRGFIAPDRGRKMALYREAERFDPNNGNVKHLLAELERIP